MAPQPDAKKWSVDRRPHDGVLRKLFEVSFVVALIHS
jgi:hypothetical protein